MDSATFQAAVTATVTAAMAQLNVNNMNRSGNSIDNFSRSETLEVRAGSETLEVRERDNQLKGSQRSNMLLLFM